MESSAAWVIFGCLRTSAVMVANGAECRALPADFGIPWRTVFGYFARWAQAGALKRILCQLSRRLRLRRRRCAWPVRVIVYSQ